MDKLDLETFFKKEPKVDELQTPTWRELQILNLQNKQQGVFMTIGGIEGLLEVADSAARTMLHDRLGQVSTKVVPAWRFFHPHPSFNSGLIIVPETNADQPITKTIGDLEVKVLT